MIIQTFFGEMDDKLLRRVDKVEDNEQQTTISVEHYLGDQLVARSAHIKLKIGLSSLGAISNG